MIEVVIRMSDLQPGDEFRGIDWGGDTVFTTRSVNLERCLVRAVPHSVYLSGPETKLLLVGPAHKVVQCMVHELSYHPEVERELIQHYQNGGACTQRPR